MLIGSLIDSGGEDEEQTRAVLLLAFICELYEVQVREGRYFLHTRSHSAKSLDQSTIVDFINRFPDTFQTVIDRSLFGPSVPHSMNTLTRWLTNPGCVAQALSSLTHSSTVRQTILSAVSQQLQSDLCVAAAKDQPQHRPLLPKLDILAVDPDEELQEEWEAEDDVKGGPLDPHEVKNAREKEIKYLWDMEVYEFSTEAEARARTGRKPVGLKWIDTNKHNTKTPRYRSRLVCTCQEEVFKVEDLFLITNADVSRAHFYADAVRDVYVRLPDEDPEAKQPGVCGKLRKTMYSSLDAAQRWGEHSAQVLDAGGVSRGVASPCHFFQKGLQTYILVHGDDFFIVGRREGRKHALSLLRGAHELSKVVTLGPESSQSRTVSFLGRTLTLRQWRIGYEPDQQHVSRALKALGLTNARGVATPGIDDAGGSKASEISELRRTAKWRDPLEEIEEEATFSLEKN